jgi:hypothetical protein
MNEIEKQLDEYPLNTFQGETKREVIEYGIRQQIKILEYLMYELEIYQKIDVNVIIRGMIIKLIDKEI